MEKLMPGKEYTLKALRESELGVFLDAGTGNTSDDILLHKAQQTSQVQIGDEVNVYLYQDPKKRLTASMRFSKIKEGEIGLFPVMSITKNGGFVDLGGERGVFLPFSQMRSKLQVGQKVWVKLYRDKSDRQAVTMFVEEDVKKLAKSADNLKIGEKIIGWVYNRLDEGWLLFTEQKHIAFLHNDEVVGDLPTMGSEIIGRITFIRPDGRINISQTQQKEIALVTDSQKILDFLVERNGRMPYGDDTPPDIIKEKFNLSKAAFKRALGQLMKKQMINQQEGWTILQEDWQEKTQD